MRLFDDPLDCMSDLTYIDRVMSSPGKPLVWLRGEVKTPPSSAEARLEAGMLLRRLQDGETLTMPQARPMSTIGARCHELRIKDVCNDWRVICRIDADAVIILDVFTKTTRQTPDKVLADCRRRLRMYEDAK
jgi:phage-related protein